jgi:hypothetical protein
MSKEKDDEELVCPHEVGFTVEEEDALNWLNHMLAERSRECNPTARVSLYANSAIAKLLKKAHELHDNMHATEVALLEAEMLIAGMAVGNQAFGAVKKDDLN